MMQPQPFLSMPSGQSIATRISAWNRQRRYPDTYGLNGLNLLRLAVVVLVVSFLAAFFMSEWISGVAITIATAGIALLFGRKAYVDNTHVFVKPPNWPKAAVAATLVYAPVGIALWLLSAAGLWFDDTLAHGIQISQTKIAGHVEERAREVEEKIKKKRSWWNPKRYFYGPIERTVLRTYKETVLVPASLGIRLFYSTVYALLRLLQYLSFASLAYLFVRSFVFVVGRSLLYAGGTVKFRLPHARELAADTEWESAL
jgi:hypothetical protein